MKLAIGIDMGGSKILGILMDEKGRIIKSYRRPTQADKPRRKIIANLVEVINNLKTKEVVGVGIGIPGIADQKGRLQLIPNVQKLRGVNLRKELEKRVRLKVRVENDANLFALAEHRHGAAKGCNNSIGIIIGTGVGTGIVIDNQIYSGSGGAAGEAGHTKLVVNKEVIEVEDLISGPDIVRRYEALSGKRAHTPRVILNKKDPFARQVYEEIVFYIGLFFANLINTFNPEAIVIGGGVSNLPFYSDIRKVVKKYAHPYMAKMCKIKKYALGDDSGVIGAAELVFCD
ncbi:hypothetical protein AYK26_02770 [Euryarchaeota archaeon SM23-78]|nr:MAG: hypothetical protein AYK26_02770 [Euryarchaeota archaeon SM23-78]MBW3000293.1 ROK family protein [Candidatus Woesearchaeota archaeon]